MTSRSSEDALINLSSEIAQDHVDKFYRAVDRDRDSLPSFYIPQITLADGSRVPTIIINGTEPADAGVYRDMIKGFGNTIHDIHCYDSQVINPHYVSDGGSPGQSTSNGRQATLAVIVSGTVRIGPPKEAEMRGFSESFVLTPNPTYSKDRRKKNVRDWLIQSQCFRFVS